MEYAHLKEMYKIEGDKVDMEMYRRLKDEKLIQICNHPTLPLSILNYTARTNYNREKWNKHLLIARGLVVDNNAQIIARPLPKFFNESEITRTIPTQQFDVCEKMDGSLIIMFFFNGTSFFCTRRSFTSEQALKAEKIYRLKYKNVEVDKEYTYCFEIIYPENRIVVNYKSEEDIFLLAKIHTKTGKEKSVSDCGFRTAKKVDKFKSLEELKKLDIENKEGFVVRFTDNNFRIKIKFKTYVHLHKFGNLSYEKVLNFLKKGEEVPIENIPDEAYEEIKILIKNITRQYECKEEAYIKKCKNIVKNTRGETEIIVEIKRSLNQSILFAIHRGKPYKHLIWKEVN